MKKMITCSLTLLLLIMFSGCALFTSIATPPPPEPEIYLPVISYRSLQFYTAGSEGTESKYRVFNDSFRKNSVDWIWYELVVRNHSEKEGMLTYREVWFDSSGTVLLETEKEMLVSPEEDYFEYSAGIKNDWKPGFYLLRINAGNEEIASREFEIKN